MIKPFIIVKANTRIFLTEFILSSELYLTPFLEILNITKVMHNTIIKDIIIVNETGLREFCNELAGADAVVSCKMHPLIISTAYGVPAYAISQHYKIDAFMEWIGRKHNCQKNSKFSPSKIVSQILKEENIKETLEIVAIRKKEIYAMIEELGQL